MLPSVMLYLAVYVSGYVMQTVLTFFVLGYDNERVNCTACGQQVNPYQRDSVYRHPMLNVLICKVCIYE